MPTEGSARGPAIPLARWADRQLDALARDFGLPRLSGSTLLGERAAHGRYRIAGKVSAGLGGSRLLPTRDGNWFALTLIREIDRDLLPALFGDADLDAGDPAAIAAAVRRSDGAALLETGRLLGLPVALLDEQPVSPAIEVIARGPHRDRAPGHRPLVIDMSAIWAGPLAGHLLWQAGMEVVKVESRSRPDLIRRDDPATFDLINQGKASVLVDFASDAEKARLVALIRRADVVIESARPRALRHLGIDAQALVGEVPGLVWLSVTGHGASGEAANWVGIGNDCGVAGGLSRALAQACGTPGYVGDAIADPLTGIIGAGAVLHALRRGEAQRIGLSMSAITAMALAEERAFDAPRLEAELRAWGTAPGRPFPALQRRALRAPVRPLGADTAGYLPALAPC
ncbi:MULTISPECIES: CoA transferase [Sphingomonadaceae]|uniref:CoA transferase n=1 Tax=Sphingomonadaceae TaxID=41297 RepID=UPI00115A233E|nr:MULTISPECIES: CoA transferase [Sphingomonadaceae]QDK32259.1 CoA transferase [Sphingomonas sp. IC081]QSR18832.1 CoA transferase [Novosphingobium sp. KA1]